jgi:hypothetical protein
MTLNDIIPKIKDFSRNQNLDNSRAIRAIDSASSFVLNQLGLPGYENEYSFDFDEDQNFYTLPTDFGEAISLRYDDDSLNKNGRFIGRTAEFLFSRIKRTASDTRLFGIYTAKGIWQLIVLAKNSKASFHIDSFNSNNSSNWVASNDATNITDDTNTYKEGAGSLRFDINVSLSGLNRATLKRTVTAQDLYSQKDVGHFKCWAYLPTITNFSSISFSWGTDASNYYKVTVTTQEDGSSFIVGWNKLDFKWSGATQVGSPNDHQITFYQFDFDYTASFTNANNFRLDYLRLNIPDKLILQYYTKYKGKDSLGNYLNNFSATTDSFLFGNFNNDIGDIIALHSAVILNPQILVDDKYVRQLYQEYYTIFVKKYPRKRGINFLFDPAVAKTSSSVSDLNI